MKERIGSFLVASLALIVVLFATSHEAQACSCLPPGPVAQEFERADAVFIGSIARARQEDRFFVIAMEVKSSWKGVEEGEIELRTAQDTAACGYPFEYGKAYIVYASKSDGELWASLCSRTRLLQGGEDEVRALDEVAKVKTSLECEEEASEGSELFPRAGCPLGQVVRVEEWGCALPLGEGVQQSRWIGAGEAMPAVCRLYGVPAIKRWRCESPAPALR